jgi:hypothetical protein
MTKYIMKNFVYTAKNGKTIKISQNRFKMDDEHDYKTHVNNHMWIDLSALFDTYDNSSFLTKKGKFYCIQNWVLDPLLIGKRLSIGSYQLMNMLINPNHDYDFIIVNHAVTDIFWRKFLGFGGSRFKPKKVRGCGNLVEFSYPTLNYLSKNGQDIHAGKLYRQAYKIIMQLNENADSIDELVSVKKQEKLLKDNVPKIKTKVKVESEHKRRLREMYRSMKK